MNNQTFKIITQLPIFSLIFHIVANGSGDYTHIESKSPMGVATSRSFRPSHHLKWRLHSFFSSINSKAILHTLLQQFSQFLYIFVFMASPRPSSWQRSSSKQPAL